MGSRPVLFTPAAREDLLQALAFYEVQGGPLVVHRFGEAVRRGLSAIAEFPQASPRSSDHQGEDEIRQLGVRKFPYLLVYLVREAEIRVLAVAHTSRNPGFWKDRLASESEQEREPEA